MTTFQNNIALLKDALGDELTTTQLIILWINTENENKDYPIADFLKENNIPVTLSAFRLAQFKEGLWHFWETLNLEEKDNYRRDIDKLYKDCAHWCNKMEEMRD